MIDLTKMRKEIDPRKLTYTKSQELFQEAQSLPHATGTPSLHVSRYMMGEKSETRIPRRIIYRAPFLGKKQLLVSTALPDKIGLDLN